jgi:amino acid transporter
MLEIIFAGLGLWMLISGHYPTRFFSGGKNESAYEVTPKQARLFGLLLIAPAPAAIIITVLLLVFFGGKAQTYSFVVELACVVLVAIIASRWAKRLKEGQPGSVYRTYAVPPPLPGSFSTHLPPPLPGNYPVQYLPYPPRDPSEVRRSRAKTGFIVTLCFTLAVAGPLLMLAWGEISSSSRADDNFWQTYSIYIVGGVILAAGLFALIKFAKVMKQ